MNLLGLAEHAGTRLAEVAFLLIFFAGIWFTAAQMPQFKFPFGRTIVAASRSLPEDLHL